MLGESLENLVGDRPAGGVEDLVGAIGQGRRQSRREIVGPMIQAAVRAEGVFHIGAFFAAAGDADHRHPGELAQLTA